MAAKTSGSSYEQDWEQFSKWLGIAQKRVAKHPPSPSGKTVKYMQINDLHVPFHDQSAIVEAVETGKKLGVNTLIIAGDVCDCYSLSRFYKFKHIPVKSEFIEARKFFDYVSRNFNKIIVLQGNHEQRERKYFSSRLSPDEVDWLLQKPMLQRCIEDIKNVELHKNIINGVDMNWIISIGDVIIGHPEKSSAVHMKPVCDFSRWINMWGRSLGMNPSPKLISIGHTHQAGIIWSGETMLIENGCLCLPQEYALQPNCYPKPQKLSYLTFNMINNKVDVNSVKQHYPFADEK